MFAAPKPSGLEDISDCGHGKQRNPGVLLRRVDVEFLDLAKLRPLLSAETSHDGNALIAFLQQADGCAADCCCRGVCNVGVRYADDIGAIRINLDFHLGTIGRPIIAHDSDAWRLLQDVDGLRRNSSERLDVGWFIFDVCIGLTGDKDFYWSLDGVCLELPHGYPCAWHLSAECGLQWTDNLRRKLFVADLHDDLGVVRLRSFRRDREPEAGSASSDEAGDGGQVMLALIF